MQTRDLARASEIARQAVLHSESLKAQEPQALNNARFSLREMIEAHIHDRWHSHPSHERVICNGLAAQYGPARAGYYRVPDNVLARDLNASSASAGGYLSGVTTTGYIETLQASAVVAPKCTLVTAGPGGIAVPRGTTPVTTTWLATETSTITESQPGFGQAAAITKIIGAYTEVSRQLLLQSNAEQIVNLEMNRAGAIAVDTAIIAGTGASGQPTGIINTAGIGTFTGASLNQAAARNAQRDVLEANAIVNPASLAYVTTPAVAELLSTRQRFTGSDRALWEGSLASGTIEGERAHATTACPTATALYGDFSSVWLVQWDGGLQIQIDPFTKFAQGIVAIRMLIPVDVIVARAAAFTVATSVT
jgi:HK97 family phage major capsid protein